jgi:hypothetical protein
MICAFAPWADQPRVQQVVGGQIGQESAWKSDSTEGEGPMNGNILLSFFGLNYRGALDALSVKK